MKPLPTICAILCAVWLAVITYVCFLHQQRINAIESAVLADVVWVNIDVHEPAAAVPHITEGQFTAEVQTTQRK